MNPEDKPASHGDLHAERKDYQRDQLSRSALCNNPVEMFARWLQDAHDLNVIDATAMTLATCTANGRPSARIVLLNDDGFCWYTNYTSRKGAELLANAHAALLFYWHDLERQVRIEGQVERLSAEQSDAYFNTRPEGSRYSAVASPQSQVVPNQQWLAERTAALQQHTPAEQLQRPENWGGYRLVPQEFEFWQGRPSRLHDRFRYRRAETPDSDWAIERLAP